MPPMSEQTTETEITPAALMGKAIVRGVKIGLPIAIAGGFPKIAGGFGYSIQIIVWSVLIPIFLAGCYCSYREVIV